MRNWTFVLAGLVPLAAAAHAAGGGHGGGGHGGGHSSSHSGSSGSQYVAPHVTKSGGGV